MNIFAPFLVVFLASTMPIHAQTGGSQQPSSADPDRSENMAQSCQSIESSMSRLACYDAIFGYESTPETVSPSTSGGWMFVEQEDQFSNQNTSYVVLNSDRVNATLSDAPSSLVVRCDGEGSYEIFVTSNGYIGARNDRIPVRYRFGQDAPTSESWHESTNGTAAFLPRGYHDFVRGLGTRQDFIFEISDYRGSRYSAGFDGLTINDDMLEFVLGGCQ